VTTSIVTGGAGFLGSHLVDALAKRGESVVVLDNLTTGRLANLESAISSGRVTFVYADVAVDATALREILAGGGVTKVDCIFHLASPASPNAYSRHPWETLAVNGIGTMSLIDIALQHHARFIFSSTSEVYGDPLVHPQSEDYFGNVDPIGPRSCYDEGKRFGEAAVAAAVSKRGLAGRIVRFFNCYGPRMQSADGRLIPALLEAAANRAPLPIQGTGEQTRSMTYVDDAIELLLLVADRRQPMLQPINIGSDDERSVNEIARLLAHVLQVEFTPEYSAGRPGDPQRRRPDLRRARALGWQAATSLEDGLRLTYDWFSRESGLFV
jgi:nucleoside-diphosphate-sugar epimerase